MNRNRLPLLLLLLLLPAGFLLLYLWLPQPTAQRLEAGSPGSRSGVIATSPSGAIALNAAAPDMAAQAALKPALRQVAQQYLASNQWPEYSLPLANSQTELLQPNRGADVQHSFEPLGLDGGLQLTLDRYRYRYGDEALAQIILSASDQLNPQISRLTLTISDRHGKPVAELEQMSFAGNQQQYRGQRRFALASGWPQELQLNATLMFVDGQQLSYSAPFEAFDAVAEITGVEDSSVDDNHLIIPVTIRDAEPGYYKLAAALLDQRQTPLAYLQGKAQLSSRGHIELKVHGSLLVYLSAPQTLYLSELQLRRIPARPGADSRIGWGHSRESRYAVPGVDPGEFDATPFQSAQVEARAEFLKNLSQ